MPPPGRATTDPSGEDELHSSAPITDRASIFTAHFSPATAPDPRRLQRLPTLAGADHRVLAWRRPSRQATLLTAAASSSSPSPAVGSSGGAAGVGPPRLDAGSDDDGERWAGARLLRVLEREGVTGAVVVGRWYGGVMLGPARFRWIEQCAEEAVRKWKRAAAASGGAKRGRAGDEEEGPVARKPRVDDAETDVPVLGSPSARQPAKETMSPVELNRARRQLAMQLPERDANIAVLRKHLAEKKARLDPDLLSSPSKGSPIAQPPEYATLSLARLQGLERARDLTVAYLLKELDKVDQQLREEEELESALMAAEEQTASQEINQAQPNGQRVLSEVEADELLDMAWDDLDEALKGS
jgi:hypothetical protein